MCGIVGLLAPGDCGGTGMVETMLAAIAHRGPDGRDIWRDKAAGVALGHARLSIIDPTAAADQPMHGCGGRYITVFNGEIYNYRSLNAELQAKGYSLNRQSDTACLAPLFDLYGPEMLRRLNGMFAFAIWDREARSLFLARDHAGIKPLYYAMMPGGIAFASELKAITASGAVGRDLDLAALHDYALRLWSPGCATPLADAKKLLPGEYLLFRQGQARHERWSAPASAAMAPVDGRPPDPADLARLFDTVVSDQCISDVPIGAFLSGGVDSTAIVAAMKRAGHPPHHSYCVGFHDTDMTSEGFGDDLAHARLAAQDMGVALTPIMIDRPTPEDFMRLPARLDEPQADPAALFVGAISAAARADGIKVLLSGAGADDLFTGYRRHMAAALRSRVGPVGRDLAQRVLRRVRPGQSALRRRLVRLAGLMQGSDDSFVSRCFDFNDRASVLACLSPEVRRAAAQRETGVWDQAIAASRDAPLVERVLHQERVGFLPDHNLNYTDKAAMAHGVEVRVPFLDPRMIAFAARVPPQHKISGLKQKHFLKQALSGHVPGAILKRRKTGFGAPVRSWVKGPLKQMIGDTIASASFRHRGVFDADAVARMFDATLANRADAAYLLLELVMIEFWLQAFVDDGAAQTRPGPALVGACG